MPAADDHADRDHITYAVYVGTTADEAASSETAFALMVEQSYELDGFGTFGAHARYVAIAAVDQAGNVGPRSPSVRVIQ